MYLHSIPFYFQRTPYHINTFYLSIHQLIDIWVVFICWLLRIMLLWTWGYKSFGAIRFSFLVGRHPGVKFLGHVVTGYLTLRGIVRLFSKVAIPFSIPRRRVRGFLSPYSLTNASYYLFDYSHSSEWISISLWFLTWSSLIANDVEYLLTRSPVICIYSLEKCLSKLLTFFKWGYLFTIDF